METGSALGLLDTFKTLKLAIFVSLSLSLSGMNCRDMSYLAVKPTFSVRALKLSSFNVTLVCMNIGGFVWKPVYW